MRPAILRRMTRRDVIRLATLAPAAVAAATAAPAPLTATRGKWRMGGTSTAFAIRTGQLREAGKNFDQVEHCHTLGMGGAEVAPPSFDPAAIKHSAISSSPMKCISPRTRRV